MRKQVYNCFYFIMIKWVICQVTEPEQNPNNSLRGMNPQKPEGFYHARKDEVTDNYDKGEFSYAVPKAGWWGFAALGAGGDLQYKGSQER